MILLNFLSSLPPNKRSRRKIEGSNSCIFKGWSAHRMFVHGCSLENAFSLSRVCSLPTRTGASEEAASTTSAAPAASIRSTGAS